MKKIQSTQNGLLPYSLERKEALDKKNKVNRCKTTPTNSLTKAIEQYVGLSGGFVARINVAGFYRQDIGYIKSGSTIGMSDLVCCLDGRFLAIEIKTGIDKQSDAQKAVEAKIQASNGVYLIAKDFDQFRLFFDEWLTTK